MTPEDPRQPWDPTRHQELVFRKPWLIVGSGIAFAILWVALLSPFVVFLSGWSGLRSLVKTSLILVGVNLFFGWYVPLSIFLARLKEPCRLLRGVVVGLGLALAFGPFMYGADPKTGMTWVVLMSTAGAIATILFSPGVAWLARGGALLTASFLLISAGLPLLFALLDLRVLLRWDFLGAYPLAFFLFFAAASSTRTGWAVGCVLRPA